MDISSDSTTPSTSKVKKVAKSHEPKTGFVQKLLFGEPEPRDIPLSDFPDDLDDWTWEDLKFAAMSTTQTFDIEVAKINAQNEFMEWFPKRVYYFSPTVNQQRVFRDALPKWETSDIKKVKGLDARGKKLLTKNTMSALLSQVAFFGRTTINLLRIQDHGDKTIYLDLSYWNVKGKKNQLSYAFFDQIHALSARGRKSVILVNLEAKRTDVKPDMKQYIYPKGYLAVKDRELALRIKQDLDYCAVMSYYNDEYRTYPKIKTLCIADLSMQAHHPVSKKTMRPNVDLKQAWEQIRQYDSTVQLIDAVKGKAPE